MCSTFVGYCTFLQKFCKSQIQQAQEFIPQVECGMKNDCLQASRTTAGIIITRCGKSLYSSLIRIFLTSAKRISVKFYSKLPYAKIKCSYEMRAFSFYNESQPSTPRIYGGTHQILIQAVPSILSRFAF